jgi:transcriptional regulator with XRE-family HTH domain
MELRLKEILAQRGITLKDFAATSGLSQSNLSNYINGNISPTLDTLKRIATHLNIDVVELFKEKDEVELYAKYNGVIYPISKEDIIGVISNKMKK